MVYYSSTSGGSVGGVSFADEDIIAYDVDSGTWSMVFDGSDVGLGAVDIDAFALLSDNTILLSFSNSSGNVPGVGTLDDSDVFRFLPTSTGPNTAGSFALIFDGSDVGLTTSGEDVDAIAVSADGNLIVSTAAGFSVNGVSGKDEDMIEFTATQFGANTSGSWSMFFDGTDVGLGGNSSSDIWGSSLDSNGDIFLTTRDVFSVTGASGDMADIFICTPISLGPQTSCSYSFYMDGSAIGIGGERLDGIQVIR